MPGPSIETSDALSLRALLILLSTLLATLARLLLLLAGFLSATLLAGVLRTGVSALVLLPWLLLAALLLAGFLVALILLGIIHFRPLKLKGTYQVERNFKHLTIGAPITS